MIVDPTGAARRPDPARARQWLEDQRIFISSAMADTVDERDAVASAATAEGSQAIRFEELGRDADPEEAYLDGVDRSTIYIGILAEQYGRLHPTGFSATETEYERARGRGKRVAVYVAEQAPGREGHLVRFIDRVRTFVTTEPFRDAADLDQRVRRRLQELAAEAISPWVKLGDYVFRADEIVDDGAAVRITARVSGEIAHAFEALRDQQWGRPRLKLTYGMRSVEGELAEVRRVVRAAGTDDLEIGLVQVRQGQGDALRAGAGGLSADDLVEVAVRALLLGEPLPVALRPLEFMADSGINRDELGEAFAQPNEVAEAITRLVVTEGLVGSGRAASVTALALGPRVAGERRIELEWLEPRAFVNVEPQRRRVEGAWRL